ncbi:DUF748 domain-containing protein [Paraburkholderia caballeronis]|uniref:DUF748 domain-containing protein n=1 Tax=Paraburkholderia caballeronis TaxID=416943 RepID=UPI0010656784|nr:DUF748 domain-containing protein [Paraburkholderia caballeronis]TDV05048.1 uncharacterized protein DUF748 [Paraburkholderia caballeronis]TDV19181.1 uncharacterized protein DUF748 [Paraburkholderia caballeronis]TDV21147.1 uncharacterized protein DUF748 [Paraburkholderia caballeronis]
MARSTRSRVAVAAVIVVAVLVLAALGGAIALQHAVKNRVVAALGPLGSAERIDVGLTSIELVNVRLKAPPDWPAPDALRAARVTITPDRRALLARRVHIRDITVSDFDLTVVRRQSGSIQLLPNLRQSVSNTGGGASPGSGSGSPPEEKLVDHIAFQHGTFEFYDRSVGNPPYRVTVGDANATVDHLRLPALDEPTQLSVSGSIRGPSHTGHVAFGGWIRIASRDSQTTTTLRGVDVATLDPYLLKKAGTKARVTGGTVDLDLVSTVRDYHLHAPGTLTLHDLQLAPTGNPLDTFMAIPTRAAIAALKTHNGNLTLHFTLEGNLRDPKFELNEHLLTEIRTGFAKALGVSAEGVVKGAGETARGLGDALRNLLGQ